MLITPTKTHNRFDVMLGWCHFNTITQVIGCTLSFAELYTWGIAISRNYIILRHILNVAYSPLHI
ncbi:hypothetical protein THOG11_20350 [Vibrio harveyi]|nr:hypothetical protein TH15OA1_530049 [Vibrio harveyi]CAH1541174.1 hypothetical protein VHARVF571_510002 [Vibrio harveyi]CAH1556954.1 hypothetical protein THOD03_20345 [Vibrio harveyi]CAH1564079.1 hypothetical protein THOG11_20350 [Vibrio harveyi]